MNFVKLFEEVLLEKKSTVELTDEEVTSKDVERAWTDKLVYNGLNVFDFYMNFLDWFERNTKELEDTSWTEKECEDVQDDEGNWDEECWDEEITREKQESYLGYIPSKDQFVTGFDMWEGDDNPAGCVYWTTDGKRFKIINEDIDYSSSMMYGRNGKYDKLHKKFKDLIDIRLD